MAYWTVVGNYKNDAARARETRAHFAKTDWVAEMKRIEVEAAKIKLTETGRRLERKLEQLRRDWKSAKKMQHYVEHGI